MDILGFEVVKKSNESPTEENDVVSEPVVHQNTSHKMRRDCAEEKRKGMYYMCILTAITLALRLHTIGVPEFVCWDETHFGKFASWYINRTFFFDVHPPLGKLAVAGMGYISGYNGSHGFDNPGSEYGDHNVYGMRVGCALMGVGVIPMGYATVYEKTGSNMAALISTTLIVFDTGLAVLSRFILLDPVMMFFIFGATLGDAKFRNQRNPFGRDWWFWLAFTGIMLGCAISTKYVGLFIFTYVGISTIQQMWIMLGRSDCSLVEFTKHFTARFICLLGIPAIIYILSFIIHFAVLTKPGNGTPYLRPDFQVLFEGSEYSGVTVPKYLNYYYPVSIRGNQPGDGFLHSHPINYPKGAGARQQMVTSYYHTDPNNVFVVKPWGSGLNYSTNQIVRHGDLVRLEHLYTGRNIHSHNIPAIMHKSHYQVTGYGWRGEGDANDIWRIETKDGKPGDIVETFKTEITFRHYFLNCYLSTSGYPLPHWAYGQKEVVCAKWKLIKDAKTPLGSSFWLIHNTTAVEEDLVQVNQISDVQTTSVENLSLSFWSKLVRSHQMMFNINGKLGYNYEGVLSDQRNDPYKWPLNIVAQTYSGKHERDKPMVWMLGNPFIWAVNLVVILILPLIIPYMLIERRFQTPGDDKTEEYEMEGGGWLLLGWALHYLPFFLMQRVLYQHHYYPASVFVSLFTGILIERYTRSIPQLARNIVIGATISLSVLTFGLFSPLVYGMLGDLAKYDNSTYHYLHWSSYWDF